MSTVLPELRSFTGWYDKPLFPTATLQTAISVEDELWLMLRSYSEVKVRGIELAKTYGVPANHRRTVWKRFRSFIRQAENYWRAGTNTSFKSSSLLFYYSFLNLVKAYLILEIPTLPDQVYHGLSVAKQGTHTLGRQKLKIKSAATCVFDLYYQRVFQRPPPREAKLLELISYVTDIAYQFESGGFGTRKAFPVVHKAMVDQKKNKLWSVFAIPSAAPVQEYSNILKDFWAVFELIKRPSFDQTFKHLFGFGSEIGYYNDFYQTKDAEQIDVQPPNIPISAARAKIFSVLPNWLSPSFYPGHFTATLNFPLSRKNPQPMNEEVAIYTIMFFMSEVVRYRPDYLDALLESKAAWLLESFVESSPSKFLRSIVSRITKNVLLLSRL